MLNHSRHHSVVDDENLNQCPSMAASIAKSMAEGEGSILIMKQIAIEIIRAKLVMIRMTVMMMLIIIVPIITATARRAN